MNQYIKRSIPLSMLMLLILGCKTYSCKKHYEDPNPFIIHFNKETIIDDTIYLSVTIYNHSETPNLVYTNPHISLEVLRDSTLKSKWHAVYPEKDHLLPGPDGKGSSMVNCRNCVENYSRNSMYKMLKKGESYTCYKRFEITGLKRKSSGYSFLLMLDWNIPSYLNKPCPGIWTGSVYSMAKVVK